MNYLKLIVVFLIISSCNSSSNDSFSSPESSWIEGASYDNGNMILETDQKDYEFVGVPIEIWEEFKSAPSKGEYYSDKIRGRYQR